MRAQMQLHARGVPTGGNHPPQSIRVASLYCVSHIIFLLFSHRIVSAQWSWAALLAILRSIAMEFMQIPTSSDTSKPNRSKWTQTKRMHLATAPWIELCLWLTCMLVAHAHTHTGTQNDSAHFSCALRSLYLSLFSHTQFLVPYMCVSCSSCSVIIFFLLLNGILCVSLFRGIPLPRSTYWNYALIAFR